MSAYAQSVLKEEEEPMFSDTTSPRRSHDASPQPAQPAQHMVIAKEDDSDDAKKAVSHEEDEFVELQDADSDDGHELDEAEKRRREERRKRRKERKKKRRKRKKKKRRKKHRNAIKKEEFEYEPDFVADLEGTDANHRPPQHVMGDVADDLAHQVCHFGNLKFCDAWCSMHRWRRTRRTM